MERVHDAYDQLAPHLPTLSVFATIIISAVFPIIAGAHASLSRPASAAPPRKDSAARVSDEDEEEEDTLQPMEALSATDAILFPVVAACILATLYWLIQRYGAKVINLIMSWYLASAGVLSVIKLLSDSMTLAGNFIFPSIYGCSGQLWVVKPRQRVFEAIQGNERAVRQSPFPGTFGLLSLPQAIIGLVWNARAGIKQKYDGQLFIKSVVSAKAQLTVTDLLAIVLGFAVVAYSNFIQSNWWLTNIQGFAVCYFALQMISPTSFAIGSLVLSGLFLYDIWAVFFTPLMVTVATELDQPIKLLFPRYDIEKEDKSMQYSMLGLGDIVLPGLLVGLCLRYDLYMFYLRKQTKGANTKTVSKEPYTAARGHWASRFWTRGLPAATLPIAIRNAAFPKPFFLASLIGYTVGLATTLGVMASFQHAQPALLYLVPAVLSSVWGTGLIRGELKQMWSYSEEVTGEAPLAKDAEKTSDKTQKPAEQDLSWWLQFKSLFASDPTADGPKQNSPAFIEKLNDPGTIVSIYLKQIASSRTIETKSTEATKSSDIAENSGTTSKTAG